ALVRPFFVSSKLVEPATLRHRVTLTCRGRSAKSNELLGFMVRIKWRRGRSPGTWRRKDMIGFGDRLAQGTIVGLAIATLFSLAACGDSGSSASQTIVLDDQVREL